MTHQEIFDHYERKDAVSRLPDTEVIPMLHFVALVLTTIVGFVLVFGVTDYLAHRDDRAIGFYGEEK